MSVSVGMDAHLAPSRTHLVHSAVSLKSIRVSFKSLLCHIYFIFFFLKGNILLLKLKKAPIFKSAFPKAQGSFETL